VGITLAISSLSFRFVKSDALMWWASDTVNTFGNYPTSIFPSAARFLLTFAFPIAFLSFFPATVFLGRADNAPFTPLLAYGAPLVGLVVFVVGYRSWHAALRHHSSTGT
jgi:ABC-2 type transport system permease protein